MKYICSVYSLNAKTNSFQDTLTRQHRYEYTMKRVAQMLKKGVFVYSPIVYTHEISCKYTLPTEYEFWEKSCRHSIDICDSLVVLKMQGWEDSIGITDEIKYAKEVGKEITYLECEDYCDPYEGYEETTFEV